MPIEKVSIRKGGKTKLDITRSSAILFHSIPVGKRGKKKYLREDHPLSFVRKRLDSYVEKRKKVGF